MPAQRKSSQRKMPLLQAGTMLALIVVLAGCTKGGQFDPTTLLDNNMFDSKKPLQGQREPVFPAGVPGVTSGIPADLYKGYQPPPEPAAASDAALTAPDDDAQAAAVERARAAPKPRVARRKPRTEIKVGLARHPRPAPQAPQAAQTDWPAPPTAQSSTTNWPAPPSSSQSQAAQTAWPAPPQTGSAPQSSQSVFPDPPATGATQ